ncbi:hypothetical protein M231_05815 [Tremella mesenterica]|uniref:Uncharacterized protein n=1 Tax=Tremella mesenterica TaxID=5217 RepID=A0A4Q1BH45_TREME|nr:hypothetical protein M231_05815 [Tremella mesenterica]
MSQVFEQKILNDLGQAAGRLEDAEGEEQLAEFAAWLAGVSEEVAQLWTETQPQTVTDAGLKACTDILSMTDVDHTGHMSSIIALRLCLNPGINLLQWEDVPEDDEDEDEDEEDDEDGEGEEDDGREDDGEG